MYYEKELIQKLNEVIQHQKDELARQDRIIFLLKQKISDKEYTEIIQSVSEYPCSKI